MTKVDLVSLTRRSVTVRHPDGRKQRIPGGRVLMVWCKRPDLEAHVAGRLRDKELHVTLDEHGMLVVTAWQLVA